jgi:iron complex transport system substrate-binding protein
MHHLLTLYCKRMNGRSLLVLMVSLIIFSCQHQNVNQLKRNQSGENLVRLAQRLSINEENGLTTVTISNPWQGAQNVRMTWYLVKRGDKPPADIDTNRIIYVPLRRIICMSTTHLAMLTALKEENTIIGMSGTQYIYSPELREKSRNGELSEVGYEANLNKELIVELKPDILMIYGVGSESSGYVGKLQELGIKVIYNADYLETDPLAKAEWIRLFGALYCKNQLADSIFSAESEAYTAIKALVVKANTSRPKVMLGLPFKDTWFVSPGNSFISTLIADAGGDYLWKETRSSVSMPLGLENVWLKAMNADFWLNIGTVSAKSDIAAVDVRLREIPCFRNGNLFNNNNRVSASGGNDFWESGTVYPHLILKDITLILHPDLFPGDQLYYYRKIN